MPYPTIVHERVDLARRGENPTVICRVRSGWAVMADEQRLRGSIILLADPVVPDLNSLDAEYRLRFLIDMTTIGDALIEVLHPSLINYSILGNADRALHVHIHPRYETEEPDKRRNPPFMYNWLKSPSVPFDVARDGPLIEQLRESIFRRIEVKVS